MVAAARGALKSHVQSSRDNMQRLFQAAGHEAA